MSRLPQPGGDKGSWGDVLNDFLSQSHNADGTLKSSVAIAPAQVDAKITAQSSLDDAKYLKLGATTVATTSSTPFIEIDNASNQSSLHLVLAGGFSGAYGLGIGVNQTNATGLVVDTDHAGTTGGQFNLLPGADSSSLALDVQVNTGVGGTGLSVATYGTAGLGLQVHAAGTIPPGQMLSLWQTDALAGTGGFGADILHVFADTGMFDFTNPALRKNGGYFVVQDDDVPNNNNVNLQRQHGMYHELYTWSGTNGLYWGGRIAGTAPGGIVLSASNGPYAVGGETWVEGFRVQDVAGAAGIGFFGATAVNKPTVSGSRSGGTALTSLLSALSTLGLLTDSTSA